MAAVAEINDGNAYSALINDHLNNNRPAYKLDYQIFTCKFPISYITMSADHDIVMYEIGNLHVKIW